MTREGREARFFAPAAEHALDSAIPDDRREEPFGRPKDVGAPIPMIDLAASHRAIEPELLARFSAVLASGRFVLGEGVAAFESELAELCQAPHAVSCNSGTDALWLALRALGVGAGDAVLCPAYSFFSTASTIVRLGARPVFADIDPATFNLDPEDAIRRAETIPNLRAIVVVDLFGRLCELGPLESYCRERGLALIEDAAQSIGAVDETGSRPAARTHAACFSFYPTKNLGALGDAGCAITGDPELADRMTRLRGHGEGPPGIYETIGINSRLDELQAVALSVKLGHLESWTRARRRLALHYDAAFAEQGACPTSEPAASSRLGLRTPVPSRVPGRHTYHRYVVRVDADRRSDLVGALATEGIASEIYYARGLHEQPALATWAPGAPGSPGPPLVETRRATEEALALPLYPEMGAEAVERIVGVVARHLRR